MKLWIVAALATFLAVPALAQGKKPPVGDPAVGQRLFLQCQSCHRVGANSVGPSLVGIVGAKAGTRPGFTSSPAMVKSGLVWTPADLDGFIARPALKIPGTRMVFGGVVDPVARRNLIAYLATLKAK